MKEIILNLSKKQKIILTIIIISIFSILFIYIVKNLYESENNEEIIVNNDVNYIVKTQEEAVISTKNEKEKVIVHIIGEVNNPGVVRLEDGSRIIDAINSAGGKTEEADLSKINLAYVVEDGTQIYIPRINENLNNIELISSEAGQGVIINSSDIEENIETKVNINISNKEKLMTLPVIGETTAQKIIDYREQNGKFKTIDELKNISGIGESKFNSLKDKIKI